MLVLFFMGSYSYAQSLGVPPPAKDFPEIKLMPTSIDKTLQLVRYARNPRIVYTEELRNLLIEGLKNNDPKQDELMASTYSALATVELGLGNQDQAIKYITQAEAYIPKINERMALSLLSDLSRIYNRSGDLEKTLYYYDKIDALTKDKPQYAIQRVFALRNRANIDLRTGNFDKLKSNYELAIKLSKESNNPSLLKDTRFAYANMLLNLNKDDEAFSILKDLIPDLDNSINDRTAQFFDILARNYEKNGDYKNAFAYAEKEFNLSNATSQQKGASITRMILLSYLMKNFSNLDVYYVAHKKYGMDENNLFSKKRYLLAEARYHDAKTNNKLAKANYAKAYQLKMDQQLAPTVDLEILTGLATVYLREGNLDTATLYFKKAEALMKRYSLSPHLRLIYTNALKNFNQYKPMGQDTLIKNLEQEIHLKDTLYQMRLSKLAGELETKYRVTEKERELELAKKQQQLQQLEIKQNKQKTWLIIIGAAIAILIVAGIAYLINQRKKQAKQIHDSTLNDLKNQHRIEIMNTLTEAQENEKKRIAERLHDEVGAMLSIAKLNINTLKENVFAAGSDSEAKLEVTKNLMTDISDTVRNISHTLMPIALEKYSFKAAILDLLTAIKSANSLNVEHVIEGLENTQNWPQNFTLSAYRIIQEILNNAIKHSAATHLFVQLIELENTLTIYIEDNGKGMAIDQLDTDGAGMKLLRTNVAYLSGKLEINGKPNEGTFALIELPIPKPTEA